jgi:hypothetical protein
VNQHLPNPFHQEPKSATSGSSNPRYQASTTLSEGHTKKYMSISNMPAYSKKSVEEVSHV